MKAPKGIFVAVKLSPPFENSIEPPRRPVLFSRTEATSKDGGATVPWPYPPREVKAIRPATAIVRGISSTKTAQIGQAFNCFAMPRHQNTGFVTVRRSAVVTSPLRTVIL